MPAITLPSPDQLNKPPQFLNKYCLCLYGEKGVGKTSLAAQFPGAMVGMLEPLRRNLSIRMYPLQGDWTECEAFIKACLADDTVKTVVIDTVDRFYHKCLLWHCKQRGVTDPNEMNDFGATWRAIKDAHEMLCNLVLYAKKGLILISHAQTKEVESRDGTGKYEQQVLSCMPAAMAYVRSACDYAMYMGYYKGLRAMYLRGWKDIWTSCGVRDRFISPEGEPLRTFYLGESPEEAYQSLIDAFENKVHDVTYTPPVAPPKPLVLPPPMGKLKKVKVSG